MEMDTGTTRTAALESNPALPPLVRAHPQRDPLRVSTVFPVPVWRAFADGFSGGILAGLLYCLGLAYFYPAGLEYAWLRVLAMSCTFGGFETWRGMRQRTRRSVRTCLLWTLAASLILFLGMDAAIAAAHRPRITPPHFQKGPIVFAMSRLRTELPVRQLGHELP